VHATATIAAPAVVYPPCPWPGNCDCGDDELVDVGGALVLTGRTHESTLVDLAAGDADTLAGVFALRLVLQHYVDPAEPTSETRALLEVANSDAETVERLALDPAQLRTLARVCVAAAATLDAEAHGYALAVAA
jgi:hypothetical protein